MTPTDPFWVLISYSMLFGIVTMLACGIAWQLSGWLYDKYYHYRMLKIHRQFICVNRPCVFGCE
jgi:hypothetical protein